MAEQAQDDEPDLRDRGNVIDRAAAVLSFFSRSESPTVGVTEIATALDLSKAVVHRILTVFRANGFVELDPASHRYRLGPQVLILGLTYLDRIDLRALGRETLSQLVAQTNETATMSVRVSWSRVYIEQVTPRRDVKMSVELGRMFPLHAGASSKALLAFLPTAEQEEYLTSQHLVALTGRTITDPDRLRQELRSVRSKGYAVSFGERDASAGSVAAPVFGYDGNLVGVLSVSGPVERFSNEMEQAAKTLVTASRELSQRLGHREELPVWDSSR